MARGRDKQALAGLRALPGGPAPSCSGWAGRSARVWALPVAVGAAHGIWACGPRGRRPGPAARPHPTACALLPQSPGRAFDLERLRGEDVHGRFQLPPRPGVRHDEPGQGLCHRAPEFLGTEEHLLPLHVRMAPPTARTAPPTARTAPPTLAADANLFSPKHKLSPKHVQRGKEGEEQVAEGRDEQS